MLPFTRRGGDTWSPATPTHRDSHWIRFQDVKSSQNFQYFSRNVENGGGETSGHLWKVVGTRMESAAGKSGACPEGSFGTQDIFKYFLFRANPDSSALKPAINSNLHQPVSPLFPGFPFHSRLRISLFLLSLNLFWAFALLSTFSRDFLGASLISLYVNGCNISCAADSKHCLPAAGTRGGHRLGHES